MATLTGVISYPIPAYSNVPIHTEYYAPQCYQISGVTLGQTTTVTTTLNNDYVVGQEVRLIIPASFGCRQLNGMTGIVISIPAVNQVVLNIYSLGGDQFISSSATTKAQILAIGDINSGVINSSGRTLNGTYIPGSFIDISP